MEAFYFSHDSNAKQDTKILQMRSVYKARGYGLYWMLVEIMREEQNYKISIKGKYAYNGLAEATGEDVEQLKEFIDDCINEFGLFQTDSEYIWSDSLIRRMGKMEEKSKQAREAVEKRWNKHSKKQNNESTTDELRTYNERKAEEKEANNDSKADEMQLNEMKRNEKKRKENRQTIDHDPIEQKNIEEPVSQSVSPETYYEKVCKFGAVTPKVVDIFNSFIQDGVEPELIIQAMQEAKDKDKGFSYAKGTLNNCVKQECLTLEQFLLKEQQFKKDVKKPENIPKDDDIYDYSLMFVNPEEV